MKIRVALQSFVLVFASLCEAADHRPRRNVDSGAKAIIHDESAKNRDEIPTVMHSKAAEAHMFHAQRAAQTPDCYDRNDMCSSWAAQGECESNPAYMLQNCAYSCGTCGADGSQNVRIGPIADGSVQNGVDSSKLEVEAKHPQSLLADDWKEALFGANYLHSLFLFVPYAILVLVFAAIWHSLGGRIPPSEERYNYRGRDFEYGLCDTDHIFNHHMWICVCAFCCCPIRMADTYSKEGKTKPILEGFWVALALTLLMHFFVDLACIIGALLFLGFAVYFRQKIRETYGLPGGGVTLLYDCLSWCLCPWCTAAQEARQIECAGLYERSGTFV